MAREITKEQQVVVRVCDEWLKEAGLPLYSEIAGVQDEQETTQGDRDESN